MRQSPELQREHARDLLCLWALATEALLGTCDAETIATMFETVRRQAAEWSEERRAEEVQALVAGELTAMIFNPEFVHNYRRQSTGALDDDE